MSRHPTTYRSVVLDGRTVRLLETRAAQVRHRACPDGSTPMRQRQVRLSGSEQLEVVARYRAGATQRELAQMYGVERRTVGEIVKRHGARRQRS